MVSLAPLWDLSQLNTTHGFLGLQLMFRDVYALSLCWPDAGTDALYDPRGLYAAAR